MLISQEELDSAYAAKSDRLNDQLRFALESSPPPRLTLEPNELAQLADDEADWDYILDDEEGDKFSEKELRQAELALENTLYRLWGVL